jgi:hypothetical protein
MELSCFNICHAVAPTPVVSVTSENLPLLTISPNLGSVAKDFDHKANDTDELHAEQAVEGSVPDSRAAAVIGNILSEFAGPDLADGGEVRSRVCGDIFHLYHQFPIAMHHELRTPFERALSAAIFIPHPDDKAAVDAVL